MARIPIEFEKIKIAHQNYGLNNNTENQRTEYLVSITEKGHNWKRTVRCGLKELTALRDELSSIIANTNDCRKAKYYN